MPPAGLWKPQINTREGLKETVRWYKRQDWL
jgi:dTDP-D-glucose 4,6-dehydratase